MRPVAVASIYHSGDIRKALDKLSQRDAVLERLLDVSSVAKGPRADIAMPCMLVSALVDGFGTLVYRSQRQTKIGNNESVRPRTYGPCDMKTRSYDVSYIIDNSAKTRMPYSIWFSAGRCWVTERVVDYKLCCRLRRPDEA